MWEGFGTSVANGFSVQAVPPSGAVFCNIYLCTMGRVWAPDPTLPHMSVRTQPLTHPNHEGTMYFQKVGDLPGFHA